MATTMVHVRMDAELKAQAEAALSSMGLNMSVAVNALARQILHQGKLPFELYAVNSETQAALKESEDILKHPEKYRS